MKKQNKNYIFIKHLDVQKIEVDRMEFNFQLETHPDYPSLLSFYDALNFYNINSFATKIIDKSILNLPTYFIAEIKQNNETQLVLVQKKHTNYLINFNNKIIKILSKDEFKHAWTGIVLIIENDREYENNSQSFLFLQKTGILLTILLVAYFSLGIAISLFLIFSGVFLSIEAIKQGYHIETNFSSKFCKATAELDCNTIINSNKFKIFDTFGFSDMSIVFFITQFISLLFFVFTNTVMDYTKISLILLTLSIPITLVSIYYQWRVAKKWCVVCLGIIVVLYAELITASLFYYNTIPNNIYINLRTIFYFSISFIIPLISWVLIKPIITKYYTLQSENKKLFKFKRNFSLFKHSLLVERKIDSKNLESVMSVGNKNSKLKISIVTNPMCNFCKKAHTIIEELLQKHSDNIQINIHFSFIPSDKNDSFKNLLHHKLVEIYLKQGEQKFMDALGSWFKNKDFEKWFSKYGKNIAVDKKSEIQNILQNQHENNRKNNILFTPSLFIGK